MLQRLKLPVYLDYSATTPTDPAVLEQMLPSLGRKFGNPSSYLYCFGWEARFLTDTARHQVSGCIGASTTEIIWTSGVTEANNIAIKGIARARGPKRKHIVTTTTEHKAVLNVCKSLEGEGFVVSYLPVQFDGTLDLSSFETTICQSTALVSVMLVNHELGTTQDLRAISRLCQKHKIPLHVDCSQAVGKTKVDVSGTPINALSLSSHKCYGPKGVGALYLSKHNDFCIKPLIHGGGQELGIRSGTLSTPQIIGMGAAYDRINQGGTKETKKAKRLCVVLVAGLLLIRLAKLNGSMRWHVPHCINIQFDSIEGEALVQTMKSISVSTGSACASASFGQSYVLQSLGHNSGVRSSVRFTVGRFTSRVEISFAVLTASTKIGSLRQLSGLWLYKRFNAVQ